MYKIFPGGGGGSIASSRPIKSAHCFALLCSITSELDSVYGESALLYASQEMGLVISVQLAVPQQQHPKKVPLIFSKI